MFVSFASRFFGTACEHDTQRMASGRRSHRVGEDYQFATATVRRVAKSFSAVSSAWEPSSASSPTSRRSACGARPTKTGPQHWQRLRVSRHPPRCWGHRGVADSQGVTEEGRERRENSSPTGGWRVATTRLRRPCRRCDSPKRRRSRT